MADFDYLGRWTKPTIPQVVDKFVAYHDKPENVVWGSLHIVLEDSNVADHHVEFCYQWAIDHNDPDGAVLAQRSFCR